MARREQGIGKLHQGDRRVATIEYAFDLQYERPVRFTFLRLEGDIDSTTEQMFTLELEDGRRCQMWLKNVRLGSSGEIYTGELHNAAELAPK